MRRLLRRLVPASEFMPCLLAVCALPCLVAGGLSWLVAEASARVGGVRPGSGRLIRRPPPADGRGPLIAVRGGSRPVPFRYFVLSVFR
ncbi:hypothetical protein BITS_1630 [Bifidobacterium tsurumiense]|uniref:Uncharacterized protein n=1 Tax=Bifidobacterium tsurumiense TaxID=356829 RepID=A0A087EBE8_9BIFI|nr:hypothetical protein BITS_1630 [Bifidobacterium tsurumiense]